MPTRQGFTEASLADLNFQKLELHKALMVFGQAEGQLSLFAERLTPHAPLAAAAVADTSRGGQEAVAQVSLRRTWQLPRPVPEGNSSPCPPHNCHSSIQESVKRKAQCVFKLFPRGRYVPGFISLLKIGCTVDGWSNCLNGMTCITHPKPTAHI